MTHGMKVIGLIVAICAAVTGNLEILPAALLGLAPWLKLTGFVGGIVMAYLLDPSVKLSDGTAKRIGAVVLAIGLGAGALGSGACALVKVKPGTTATESQQAAKLHDFDVATKIVDKIGIAVKAVQSTEIAYHNGGKISDADHKAFQGYLVKWADAMLTLKPAVEDLTRPEASRDDVVKQAIAVTNDFIEKAIVPVKDENTKLGIRLALAQIEALLPTLELLIH